MKRWRQSQALTRIKAYRALPERRQGYGVIRPRLCSLRPIRQPGKRYSRYILLLNPSFLAGSNQFKVAGPNEAWAQNPWQSEIFQSYRVRIVVRKLRFVSRNVLGLPTSFPDNLESALTFQLPIAVAILA